jgi:NADH:ubiquinone oxidoreductase subunit H
VNSQLFWRALVVQAICAGVPFAVLVALPLPDEVFDDAGFVIGPVVWLAAAFVATRFIPVPRGLVMFSALVGLVAGTIVLLIASHTPGGVVALLVFAASCAGYDEREAAGAGAGGSSDRAGRAG